MSATHNGRLSSIDASFLYLERDAAPMHGGALCRFDGEIEVDRYRCDLAAKLARGSRLRQRAVPTPFYLGHPTWENDPDFDLDRHLVVHDLGTGDESELESKVNALIAKRLDRARPLWELHLIHGLADGSSALVSKVHRALDSGTVNREFLGLLFDYEREPPVDERRQREGADQDLASRAPDPITRRERISSALWETAQTRIDAWSGFLRSVTAIGRNYEAERSQTVLAVLAETIPDLMRPPRRLPFNRLCSGQRALYGTSVSFAEARAIRGALGGSVNDVMLAVLAGALSRYSELHGLSTSGRTARVLVPAAVRPSGTGASSGGQVSLPVPLPLGISDPVRRLKIIRGSTRTLREGRIAEGLELLSSLGSAVPVPLLVGFGSLGDAPFPMFNLACTNVPGPQVPLYAAGRRLDAYYPYVPVGFHVGLACSIFSYNQRLFVGFNSDAGACSDAGRLCALFDECFLEMKELAGVADLEPIRFGADSRTSQARCDAVTAAS